jgi:hypothetical protein
MPPRSFEQVVTGDQLKCVRLFNGEADVLQSCGFDRSGCGCLRDRRGHPCREFTKSDRCEFRQEIGASGEVSPGRAVGDSGGASDGADRDGVYAITREQFRPSAE